MKVRLVVAALVLFFGAVWGAPDNYAAGTGGTQPLNLNAVTQSGAYGNPAFLGLDRAPRAGLSVLPMSFGLWSDELALPSLLNKYLWEGDMSRWLTLFFYESFDLWDVKDKPSEVSKKLTEGMKDGVGVNFGYQVSPLVFSMNGLSVGLRTYVDLEARLPGGILLPLFSETKGLLRGNELDFSTLGIELIAATELAVKFGRPLSALPSFFDYLNLDKGAYGVGVKHVLGHSYLKMEAGDSKIKYDATGNMLDADVEIKITSAGTGLGSYKGDLDFESRYWDSTFLTRPAAGEGWGFDLGAVFHNGNHFVSVDARDIGVIVWGGGKAQTVKLPLKVDSLDLADLLEGNWGNDDEDGKPTFESGYFVTSLPLSLNLGYTYYYDLSDMGLRYLAKYLTADAGFNWQLVSGPGKYTSLSLGGAAGLIDGVLPLRYGFILGGPGSVSSAVSAGFNTRYVSLDVCWKAVGHPLLVAKKGFETAAAFTVNWGWAKKKKAAGHITKDTAVFVPAPAPTDSVLTPDTAVSLPADSVLIPDTSVSAPTDSVLIPDTAVSLPSDSVLIPDTAVSLPSDSVLTPAAPTPAPVPIAPTPAPVPVAPTPAPVPIAPTPAPVPVAPLPAPVPVAPPPAPAPPTESSASEAAPAMTFEEELKRINEMLGAVQFSTGPTGIMEAAAGSHAALDEAAAVLGKYPNMRYEVRGYTDFDGASMYVTAQSALRAVAVRNYIASKGVSAANIVAVGQGRNAAAGGLNAPDGNIAIAPVQTKAQFDALRRVEAEQRR